MPGPVLLTTSWLRWPLLFLYINCLLCLSSVLLAFSPASKEIANAFDVSIVEVNSSYLIASITGIPMTFASMFLFRKFPAHWVLRVACLNALIGGWFRIFSHNGQYWPIIVGTVIMTFSTPLLAVQMTQFCNRWFSDDERTLATVICALTIPGGNVVGFMLAGIVFQGIEK